MKRILPLILMVVLLAVSCRKDEIIVEPRVHVNNNGIPVVNIKTDDGVPVPSDRTQSVRCTIRMMDEEGYQMAYGPGEIHGRGNATWGYEKKPYKIKFDEKKVVCGFPANRDWVLMACYCDKSLLRESFMHKVGEYAGLPYTVRHRHAEVILNGDNLGVYLLTEQVEGAKDRVPVEADGFIFEPDGYWSREPVYVRTKRGHNFTFKHPKAGEEGGLIDGDENYRFFVQWVNEMEDAVYGSDFKDPLKGYRAYIEPYSFARWYLTQEIIGNYDTNMYMVLRNHKSKLECFPTWDAEWSFGLAGSAPTGGWARPPQQPIVEGNIKLGSIYINRMMKDPYFVGIVKDEWAKLKVQLPQIKKEMREEAAFISKAQVYNFERWPILDRYISVGLIHLDSWEAEVDYVFDWFDKRCAWFDSWIATQ